MKRLAQDIKRPGGGGRLGRGEWSTTLYNIPTSEYKTLQPQIRNKRYDR